MKQVINFDCAPAFAAIKHSPTEKGSKQARARAVSFRGKNTFSLARLSRFCILRPVTPITARARQGASLVKHCGRERARHCRRTSFLLFAFFIYSLLRLTLHSIRRAAEYLRFYIYMYRAHIQVIARMMALAILEGGEDCARYREEEWEVNV